MVSALALSSLVLSAVSLVHAAGNPPVPSAPGPGEVFNTGAQCPITWSADSTGLWSNMAIQLMTGDNWNMVPLTTVAEVNAATTTTFSWTCPTVSINAPIYFYQFSAQGQNLTWTTRFTIASASGATVPAPNTTQPDGQQIGWGVGALVGATTSAPPPWLGSAAGATSAPASVAPASSAAATTSAPASSASAAVVPSAASSAAAGAGAGAGAASSASAAAASASASAKGNTTTASNTNNTSGALGLALGRSVGALALVAGVFALAL